MRNTGSCNPCALARLAGIKTIIRAPHAFEIICGRATSQVPLGVASSALLLLSVVSAIEPSFLFRRLVMDLVSSLLRPFGFPSMIGVSAIKEASFAS